MIIPKHISGAGVPQPHFEHKINKEEKPGNVKIVPSPSRTIGGLGYGTPMSWS